MFCKVVDVTIDKVSALLGVVLYYETTTYLAIIELALYYQYNIIGASCCGGGVYYCKGRIESAIKGPKNCPKRLAFHSRQ